MDLTNDKVVPVEETPGFDFKLDLAALAAPDGAVEGENVVRGGKTADKKTNTAATGEQTDDELGDDLFSDGEATEDDASQLDDFLNSTKKAAEGKGSQDAQKEEKKSDTGRWDNVQALLRAKLGQEVSIPVNGSDDEVMDAISELFEPDLHPDAARYDQHLKNGGKPEDYFRQRNWVNEMLAISDPKDLLMRMYKAQYGKSEKRPDGVSDDDIKDEISKKEAGGNLKFEAMKVKEALRQQQQKTQQQEEAHVSRGKVDPKDPQAMATYYKNIDDGVEAVAKSLKDGKLYGLDLSKAGNLKALKELVRRDWTPNEKGKIPFQLFLQGNDNSVRLTLLKYMAEKGHIDGSILNAKNGVKKVLMDSLGTQPQVSRGGRSGQAQFDVARATAPERFVDAPAATGK